ARPTAVAQVIFFNNVGMLGMCVHGTIGVAATLRWLGRIAPEGRHVLETPVGDVTLAMRDDGTIAVENVESYRTAKDVEVRTAGHGTVRGDVAFGGNWFFLTGDPGGELSPARIRELTDFAVDVRRSLATQGVTGTGG